MNYIVFTFSVIISLAAFWFSIKFIRLYFKVKKWTRVDAIINSKEIFLHPKTSSSRSPYGIKVNYSFKFNNKECTGNNLYLVELAGGQVNHMKNSAEKQSNKIKDTMSIYVNPQNSTQSVIYCDGIVLYMFVFFMGIFSLLIGISKII